MSEELKPCPWCKTKPSFVRSYSKTRLSHECEIIRINLSWGNKEELTKLWNNQFNNEEKKKPSRFTPDLSFIENEDWKVLYQEWVDNKKSPFKKQIGVQKGFTELFNISAYNIETGRKIVDKSLANNWSGLYELKGSDIPVQNIEMKTETPEEIYAGMLKDAENDIY